jgi:hypothetical protein
MILHDLSLRRHHIHVDVDARFGGDLIGLSHTGIWYMT